MALRSRGRTCCFRSSPAASCSGKQGRRRPSWSLSSALVPFKRADFQRFLGRGKLGLVDDWGLHYPIYWYNLIYIWDYKNHICSLMFFGLRGIGNIGNDWYHSPFPSILSTFVWCICMVRLIICVFWYVVVSSLHQWMARRSIQDTSINGYQWVSLGVFSRAVETANCLRLIHLKSISQDSKIN